MYFRGFVFLFALVLGGASFDARAQTTRTVDTTADNGALTACSNVTPNDCSLRGAIAASAASGDTINFSIPAGDPNCTGGVCIITLGGTQLSISKSLTINGTGANSLTVSANNASRVFFVSGSITALLSGMMITGGNLGVNNGSGIQVFAGSALTLQNCTVSGNITSNNGGGISVFSTGTLTVLNSTISNNTAGSHGGIDAEGALTVINSTISGNVSMFSGGGGIFIGPVSTTRITNSTITNNRTVNSPNNPGGVVNNGTSATVRNTIIAANQNNMTSPDVTGNFISAAGGGNNLIGNVGLATGFTNNVNGDKVGGGANPVLDPLLGGLQNNGGTTPTHLLFAGSPAIDAGNNCVVNNSCNPALPAPLTTDQRGAGFPRQFGMAVDIGAFETQGATAASVTVAGRVLSASGRGISKARVTLTDSNGETRIVLTNSFGYYRFDEVEAGATYILSVQSKGYQFADSPRVIFVAEETNDLNFRASPRASKLFEARAN